MEETGSRGPEIKVPVNCTTIELKDLADVIDFDDRGEVGEIYGFEFTDNGLYKRKEIDVKIKNPKFSQLRDVHFDDPRENINYFLKYDNKKWTLVPSVNVDWEVRFEFISPFTLVSKDFTFRKALNSGPLIVSLISDAQSRGKIAVKPYMKNKYVIHRKDNIDFGAQETVLEFIPKIEIGDSFTMIFDIILRPSNKSVSTTIMKGINFSWRDIGDEEIRVFVAIQKKKDVKDVNAVASNESLEILVNKENLTHLEQINLTHLDLIAFYYTDKVINEDELEIFSKKMY